RLAPSDPRRSSMNIRRQSQLFSYSQIHLLQIGDLPRERQARLDRNTVLRRGPAIFDGQSLDLKRDTKRELFAHQRANQPDAASLIDITFDVFDPLVLEEEDAFS